MTKSRLALPAMLLGLFAGPAMALAAPAPAPSVVGPNPATAIDVATVTLRPLTAEQNAALKEEIASGRWNGKPAWGLTQSQTEHLVAFDVQRDSILAAWFAKNFIPGQMAAATPGRPTTPVMFGPDYAAYVSLEQLRGQYRLANFTAEMATPVTGPASTKVRADQIPVRAISEAGMDPRGTWAMGPADQAGVRTLTRVSIANPDPGVVVSVMAFANIGKP